MIDDRPLHTYVAPVVVCMPLVVLCDVCIGGVLRVCVPVMGWDGIVREEERCVGETDEWDGRL